MYKAEERPIGVSEVSVILNVKPDTVSSWQLRGITPKPDCLINKGRTRLWKVQTILDWASATGRNKEGLNADAAETLLEASNINGKTISDISSKVTEFKDDWGNLGDYE